MIWDNYGHFLAHIVEFMLVMYVKIKMAETVKSSFTCTKDIQHFQCISYNLKNLSCSWDLPDDSISSTSCALYVRSELLDDQVCPKGEDENSCILNSMTDPPYIEGTATYTFSFKGQNRSKSEQEIQVNHDTIILAAKPRDLRAIPVRHDSVLLLWSVEPPMDTFEPGLNIKITYTNKNLENHSISLKPSNVVRGKNQSFTLCCLNSTYPEYDVQLFLRANTSSELWSAPAVETFFINVTTPHTPVPPYVIRASSHGVSVAWTKSTQPIVEYRALCCYDSLDNSKVETSSQVNQSLKLTNLKCGWIYTCYLRHCNFINCSEQSEAFQISTRTDAPGEMQAPHITILEGKAIVFWEIPTKFCGFAANVQVDYEIYYRMDHDIYLESLLFNVTGGATSLSRNVSECEKITSAVRAVTFGHDKQPYFGQWSKKRTEMCTPRILDALLWKLTSLAVFAVICLFIVTVICCRCWKAVNQIQTSMRSSRNLNIRIPPSIIKLSQDSDEVGLPQNNEATLLNSNNLQSIHQYVQ